MISANSDWWASVREILAKGDLPDQRRRKQVRIGTALWEQITRPEYTVRFKWNEGDIAFWDNRSTVHLAPTDIFESDFDRQLFRVTLVGKPLVGVDGQPSKSIEGVPILSAAEELKMLAAAE